MATLPGAAIPESPSTVPTVKSTESFSVTPPDEVTIATVVIALEALVSVTGPPARTARSLTARLFAEPLTPAAEFRISNGIGVGLPERSMSPVSEIAPVDVSPMISLSAAIRLNSAFVSPSVAGSPAASAPPRSIVVPAVRGFTVTV